MFLPDFRLAPFGDTDSSPVGTARSQRSLPDTTLRWFMSKGAEGTPPAAKVQSDKLGGWAFARIHRGDPSNASYLAQMTAFHSRVSKHADHGTFVWNEGPLAILSDPGRYSFGRRTKSGSELHQAGFRYSDPSRIYVERTRSHNCVEVDGLDHPRVGVQPFKTGVIGARKAGDLVIFQSRIPIGELVRQDRLLILDPGRWLIVIDSLAIVPAARMSGDNGSRWRRDGLLIAPAVVVSAASTLERTLWIEELLGAKTGDMAYGQADPVRGWASIRAGELVPAQGFCFERLASPNARFATVFGLDRVITPLPGTVWEQSQRTIQVAVQRRG
jgi:hypothetical protein